MHPGRERQSGGGGSRRGEEQTALELAHYCYDLQYNVAAFDEQKKKEENVEFVCGLLLSVTFL